MGNKTDWYKEAVVYQVYPLSFMDSNNDGIGDIAGIISKLDYIKELGVTAIWFSPLYASPWKDYGYDISDYRAINPAFGTMDDFVRLADECHKRGLKVIMDMVVNHTSDQHEWFQSALADVRYECEHNTSPGSISPYRDFYIFRKGRTIEQVKAESGRTKSHPAGDRVQSFLKAAGTGKAGELMRDRGVEGIISSIENGPDPVLENTGGKLLPPTNWTSTFTGSAWERVEGTDYFYLHLFAPEQPDLNWENDEVRKEIVSILKFWLNSGVDGFRFDVFNLFSKVYPLTDDHKGGKFQKGTQFFVDGPRMHEFLKQLNSEALSQYDSYTVGESFSPDPEEAYNYIKSSRRELDTIFNFEHLNCDNVGGLKYIPKPFNLIEFKNGFFGPQTKYYDDAWNTLVLENHDCARSVSRFGIDTARYRYEAATFLATISFMGWGTPFIYMGEEIGMTNADFRNIGEMMDPVSHFIYDMVTSRGMPKGLALRMIKTGARDNARVPMQWDASGNAGFNRGARPWQCMNPNYREINVEEDLASQQSIYRYYQKLIKIKRGNPVAIYGKTTEYDHRNRQVIAYSRTYEGRRLLVVGNFSGKSVSWELPSGFSADRLKVLISNYINPFISDRLSLRPYEAIVLECE